MPRLASSCSVEEVQHSRACLCVVMQALAQIQQTRSLCEAGREDCAVQDHAVPAAEGISSHPANDTVQSSSRAHPHSVVTPVWLQW